MNIQQKLPKIKPLYLAGTAGVLGVCGGYVIGVYNPPPRPPPKLMEEITEQSQGMDGVQDTEVPNIPITPVIPVETKDNASETKNEAGKYPVYASISGTKYYFSWCSRYASIKKENLRTFIDEAAAMAAGYERAKNCSPTNQIKKVPMNLHESP